jgi:nucleoside 2-deoxyribosyltransferase
MTEKKKFCFVLSPIGEPGSSDRERANGILDEIIRPALEPLDYRVERADHDKTPGIVTNAIITKIIDADLVVADLTALNPNVMYELAVRHATQKPVVQMMEEGSRLPFDVQEMHTVFFRAELVGRSKAVKDLETAAASAVREEARGNPIRRAVEFKALAAQAGPESERLAELLMGIQTQLSYLRSGVEYPSPHVSLLLEARTERIARDAINILESNEEFQAANIRIAELRVDGERVNVTAVTEDGDRLTAVIQILGTSAYTGMGSDVAGGLMSQFMDQLSELEEEDDYSRQQQQGA